MVINNNIILYETTIQLLMEQPFYGRMLTAIPKEFSETIATISIELEGAATIKILVNPKYWELSLKTEKERQEKLVEVCNHLIFKRFLLESDNFENEKRESSEIVFSKKIKSLSPSEIAIFSILIDFLIKNAFQKISEKEKEKLPEGVSALIENLENLGLSKINWRKAIRHFASSSRSTQLKNTIRRPSKRYGTTPGLKLLRKQKFLVAIDISGSIQADVLTGFFKEIYHLWRQGVEVWVVECDYEIRNTYPFKGGIPKIKKGFGGTSFNAPIQFANDSFFPDGIIYFTDGLAPAPVVPIRFPILWVLSKKERVKTESLPGRVVEM